MYFVNLLKNLFQRRCEIDLEKVALEAVKVKIQEIFDEILVTTAMEGKDIVIRIKLPDEIMKKTTEKILVGTGRSREEANYNLEHNPEIRYLDKEAQSAANELLGTDANPQT